MVTFHRPADTKILQAPIAITSNNETNEIVAASTLNIIRVVSLFFICDGVVDVRFEDGSGGASTIMGVMSFGPNGGIVLPENLNGWFETITVNTTLNMEVTNGTNPVISGTLKYQLIDPNIT